MIDLRKYLFNDVVLVDIDNKTWKGGKDNGEAKAERQKEKLE